MTYEINPKAARTVGVSSYLRSSGKYIGTFLRAEHILSRQKTIGIEFTFKTRDGQEAEFLQIWTKKSDGTLIEPGIAMVSAILACLSLRGIKEVDGMVEKRNRDTGQKESVRAKIFPELLNKEIGLVLQEEEYQKEDLTLGTTLKIIAPFQASSELTAGEILDRKTAPEMLERIMQQLMANPVKKAKPRRGTQAAPNHSGTSYAHLDQMDDDIPFD